MTTKLGLEVLLESRLDLVAGKRVGLVACPSSVDRHLRSSVELLHQHPDINLVALFGPEHGIRGDAQAGAKVDSAIDPLTQLPVHSLYGQTQRPDGGYATRSRPPSSSTCKTAAYASTPSSPRRST